MSRPVRYTGGGIAVVGLAVAASFVGPRTADPVAAMVVGFPSLGVRIGGIVLGLISIAAGLRLIGSAGG
ncbi:hypothetical protein [Halorarum salinum]|uniref:Uncharacterized protein n=1 Tax=Halorarum salinum TaxID=2743089 RepID=A0A7D5L9D8_9EURY|nr:hypothetical protein [Halobaculum salinum]QLG60789.1 hypothetical protein HUG12_03120 [Halobaculum salinum]